MQPLYIDSNRPQADGDSIFFDVKGAKAKMAIAGASTGGLQAAHGMKAAFGKEHATSIAFLNTSSGYTGFTEPTV